MRVKRRKPGRRGFSLSFRVLGLRRISGPQNLNWNTIPGPQKPPSVPTLLQPPACQGLGFRFRIIGLKVRVVLNPAVGLQGLCAGGSKLRALGNLGVVLNLLPPLESMQHVVQELMIRTGFFPGGGEV